MSTANQETGGSAFGPANGSAINADAEQWAVFERQWYVLEGFMPNKRDTRVMFAWVWFDAGKRYGTHISPNAEVSERRAADLKQQTSDAPGASLH